MDSMAKIDQDFDQFMSKVDKIDNIVRKLASDDQSKAKLGIQQADEYLNGRKRQTTDIDVENVDLRVVSNRTLVNRQALAKDDRKDASQMSQEAFMAEIERDANERYKARCVAKERAETLKTRAKKAYGAQCYEKALVLYDQAITHVKDDAGLYLSRALVQFKLGRPAKAAQDCQTALRRNENSLRGWLLWAKACRLLGDAPQADKCVQEARQRHQDKATLIEDYLKELESSSEPTPSQQL